MKLKDSLENKVSIFRISSFDTGILKKGKTMEPVTTASMPCYRALARVSVVS